MYYLMWIDEIRSYDRSAWSEDMKPGDTHVLIVRASKTEHGSYSLKEIYFGTIDDVQAKVREYEGDKWVYHYQY